MVTLPSNKKVINKVANKLIVSNIIGNTERWSQTTAMINAQTAPCRLNAGCKDAEMGSRVTCDEESCGQEWSVSVLSQEMQAEAV